MKRTRSSFAVSLANIVIRSVGCGIGITSSFDLTSLLAAGVVVLASSAPADAHHSPSAFDQTREVVVVGTIKDVSWKNPHVYFTVQTAGPDGGLVDQEIHAGSASALAGMGVPRDALAVGRRVSVRAFPPRRASARVVLGFELSTDTGELLPLEWVGSSRAGASPAATVTAGGLSGRWLPQRTGLREGGYGPAVQQRLTAAGQASAADVESYRASVARCEAWPAPLVMMMPMVRDITLDSAAVKISIDWMGSERVIDLSATEHPVSVAPSVQGHSIGHWEGETLVIDTVAFTPNRSGVTPGVSSGPGKRMVERLTLTPDKLQLRYELTIEDPEYLTEPVSATQLWDHRPDIPLSGESCDPAVARRFLELE